MAFLSREIPGTRNCLQLAIQLKALGAFFSRETQRGASASRPRSSTGREESQGWLAASGVRVVVLRQMTFQASNTGAERLLNLCAAAPGSRAVMGVLWRASIPRFKATGGERRRKRDEPGEGDEEPGKGGPRGHEDLCEIGPPAGGNLRPPPLPRAALPGTQYLVERFFPGGTTVLQKISITL